MSCCGSRSSSSVMADILERARTPANVFLFCPEVCREGMTLLADLAREIERLGRELAKEKERADYAWQNTRIVDNARMKAERENAAVRKVGEAAEQDMRDGRLNIDMQTYWAVRNAKHEPQS